jgi:hypothetical protein
MAELAINNRESPIRHCFNSTHEPKSGGYPLQTPPISLKKTSREEVNWWVETGDNMKNIHGRWREMNDGVKSHWRCHDKIGMESKWGFTKGPMAPEQKRARPISDVSETMMHARYLTHHRKDETDSARWGNFAFRSSESSQAVPYMENNIFVPRETESIASQSSSMNFFLSASNLNPDHRDNDGMQQHEAWVWMQA